MGHKVEGLGFIAISGFALSAAALVGQNLGAAQEGRARQAVRLTVGYCLVVTAATAIAFLAIPGTLVSLFTADAAVIADGALYLRVIALAQIGQTFEIILEGALAGAGYTLWPQIVGTVLTLSRVPLAAWWSGPLGLLGIWLALSITAIARGVAMTLFWTRILARRWPSIHSSSAKRGSTITLTRPCNFRRAGFRKRSPTTPASCSTMMCASMDSTRSRCSHSRTMA